MQRAFSLLVLLSLLFLQTTEATHFQFATLSWERSKVDPYTISFDLQMGLRRSFFGNLQVGDITKSIASVVCQPTTEYCNAGADDSGNKWRLRTGSNNHINSRACKDCYSYDQNWNRAKNYIDKTVKLDVKILYIEDDMFTGSMQWTTTFPETVPGAYVVPGTSFRDSDLHCYYVGWARIDDVEEQTALGTNSGDQVMIINSIIPRGVMASPFSVGFPREYMAVGYQWTFTIPADSKISNNLHFEIPNTYGYTWDPADTAWVYGDKATYIGVGSGLANPIPGSDPDYPYPEMDLTRLRDEGILQWYLPPASNGQNGVSYSFPLLFTMQVQIVDEWGATCPYDFIIEVQDVC